MKMRALTTATAMVTPFLLAAVPAHAQDSEAQEIIVTAQKREQALIDVPAAITAIGGDQLRATGTASFPAVAQQVPGFTVEYERGKNATPSFNIRGVAGDGLGSRLNESSVAIYTDDVYLGDENMLNGQIFDVQRVEILRGPQGTLFGRNTTAGLVHFVSQSPTDEVSGYGSVGYGQNDDVTLEGAISGGLASNVRARVSGKWNRNDGNYRNKYLGAGQNGVPKRLGATNIWGIRGILDVDLGERTTIRLIGAYSNNDSQVTPFNMVGSLKPGTTIKRPYTRADQCSASDIFDGNCVGQSQLFGSLPNAGREAGAALTAKTADQLRANGDGGLVTLKLTHEFEWATLTSIANYATNNFHIGLDGGRFTPSVLPGNPLTTAVDPYITVDRKNKAHQYSEELRLNGATDSFSWVVGAFYYTDSKSSQTITGFPLARSLVYAIGAVDSHSYALFGQLDNHLSETISVSIGGRYTSDKRELKTGVTYNAFSVPQGGFQDVRANMIAAGLPVKSNTRDFTGSLGVKWKPSSTASYYLNYSRGIKGAGFNTGWNPGNSVAANNRLTGPVPQEILDSFEIGAKNRLFDRKLSINTALFFYQYQGKQQAISVLDTTTGIATFNYIGSGDAQVWGAETEIGFKPNPHWDFNLSGSVLGNKITKSSIVTPDNFGVPTRLQGKHLYNTPTWTFNAVVAYHLPIETLGEFTLQTEVNGVSSRNYSIVNDPLSTVPSVVLANLRLLWQSPNGMYNAQVFVTNLFDTPSVLRLSDNTTSNFGTEGITEGEGRLWGIRMGLKF
ncbi:TonB-dependent receptor [Sphingobium subterraneum]|uniref:Iron complex outermembrane receptor protein n=1 Tax=Sphingobium subterraneum TaxID=627688 RepID=A0A841J1H1_9SPHN|nr:TonB-dependent receptor [Sphingobium subterraneum]MBB6123376.1 iron complex outermembrane receptor protein [Sphingobium subterraneum]